MFKLMLAYLVQFRTECDCHQITIISCQLVTVTTRKRSFSLRLIAALHFWYAAVVAWESANNSWNVALKYKTGKTGIGTGNPVFGREKPENRNRKKKWTGTALELSNAYEEKVQRNTKALLCLIDVVLVLGQRFIIQRRLGCSIENGKWQL